VVGIELLERGGGDAPPVVLVQPVDPVGVAEGGGDEHLVRRPVRDLSLEGRDEGPAVVVEPLVPLGLARFS
jgi:hypothetical protein